MAGEKYTAFCQDVFFICIVSVIKGTGAFRRVFMLWHFAVSERPGAIVKTGIYFPARASRQRGRFVRDRWKIKARDPGNRATPTPAGPSPGGRRLAARGTEPSLSENPHEVNKTAETDRQETGKARGRALHGAGPARLSHHLSLRYYTTDNVVLIWKGKYSPQFLLRLLAHFSYILRVTKNTLKA